MTAIRGNSHHTFTFEKKISIAQSLTVPREVLTFPRNSIIFHFLSHSSKTMFCLNQPDSKKKIRKQNITLIQNLSQMTIPEKHPLPIIQ